MRPSWKRTAKAQCAWGGRFHGRTDRQRDRWAPRHAEHHCSTEKSHTATEPPALSAPLTSRALIPKDLLLGTALCPRGARGAAVSHSPAPNPARSRQPAWAVQSRGTEGLIDTAAMQDRSVDNHLPVPRAPLQPHLTACFSPCTNTTQEGRSAATQVSSSPLQAAAKTLSTATAPWLWRGIYHPWGSLQDRDSSLGQGTHCAAPPQPSSHVWVQTLQQCPTHISGADLPACWRQTSSGYTGYPRQ